MKVYGLIGRSLVHSFSKKFFEEKFLREEIQNCEYRNFEIIHLAEKIQELKENPLVRGLNVTIPYKTAVIPFLDELSPACREIQACNCIKITDGKWIGYNTDVTGFERTFLPHLKPFHKKALILGTGGASNAVAYALKEAGISFLKVSRAVQPEPAVISYSAITPQLLADTKIIINTTPLGTFPNVDECPPLPYGSLTPMHYCYDLIYNPPETLFLKKAAANGATVENGRKMLEIQAEESWRIWNS